MVDRSGKSEPRRSGPWLLALLPSLLTLLIVFGLPVIELIFVSVHTMTGPAQYGDEFDFENYGAFFLDDFIVGILLRTVGLGLVVVVCCLLIGYPVAYLLARTTAKWRDTAMFLVTASLLVSSVVRNLGWFPILGETGLVNTVLQAIGLTHAPVRLVGNFAGVVIGLVHAQLPIMILTLTTVIQRIEPEFEEAAQNLGAAPAEAFWRVVLPLRPACVVSGSLLIFTLSISAFTTPAILGGNRVLIMAIYVAQQFQSVLDYPAGASAAILLLVTVALLTTAALRIRARGSQHS